MLLQKACTSSARHILVSRGRRWPCHSATAVSTAAATATRTAITVSGGISATATFNNG